LIEYLLETIDSPVESATLERNLIKAKEVLGLSPSDLPESISYRSKSSQKHARGYSMSIAEKLIKTVNGFLQVESGHDIRPQ
jgi:hypothetical protein